MIVSVIGLGFVGNSIYEFFKNKDLQLLGYDKFKNGGVGKLDECLKSNISFFCLPTIFDSKINEYDKSAIIETCQYFSENNYNGIIILKSTVEPLTTNILSNRFKNLKIIHNPEFLTARTAVEDFNNQNHIVLGLGDNCNEEDGLLVKDFYFEHFKNAEISLCKSEESECMKIFLNCFYSVKVQFFNELYLTAKDLNLDYNNVLELMLKNGWINKMHTTVPGPDGKLSYGGLCFPKDTNALNNFMKNRGIKHAVLEATIKERNEMREDKDNIK